MGVIMRAIIFALGLALGLTAASPLGPPALSTFRNCFWNARRARRGSSSASGMSAELAPLCK